MSALPCASRAIFRKACTFAEQHVCYACVLVHARVALRSHKTATVASGRSGTSWQLWDYVWIIHRRRPIKPIYLTRAVVKLHSICEGLGLSVPEERGESGEETQQLNRFKHSKPCGKLTMSCKKALWKNKNMPDLEQYSFVSICFISVCFCFEVRKVPNFWYVKLCLC